MIICESIYITDHESMPSEFEKFIARNNCSSISLCKPSDWGGGRSSVVAPGAP